MNSSTLCFCYMSLISVLCVTANFRSCRCSVIFHLCIVLLYFSFHRSMRNGRKTRNHAHDAKNVAPSELPLTQTSTLRSRRRLANILVAGSFMFIFCWTPYIVCLLCTNAPNSDIHSMYFLKYSLLLGESKYSIYAPCSSISLSYINAKISIFCWIVCSFAFPLLRSAFVSVTNNWNSCANSI